MQVAQASFQQNPANTLPVNSVYISPSIASLPQLFGAGELSDLHTAMTEDPSLTKLVTAFAALSPTADPATVEAAVVGILYEWAGVENVNPGSRGGEVNAQQLAFLEKLAGQAFDGQNGSNPIFHAAPPVNAAWNTVYSGFLTSLILQSPLASTLLPGFSYNSSNGAITTTSGLSVLQNIYAQLGPLSEANASRWDIVLRATNILQIDLGIDPSSYDSMVSMLTDSGIGSYAAAISNDIAVSVGPNGSVTETGSSLNDTFYAGSGVVKAIGNGGGATFDDADGLYDTFVYGSGDGQFEVDEEDTLATSKATNLLEFTGNITASSISVHATSDGTGLVVTDGVTGDKVTIDGMLSPVVGMSGVEEISFADGSILSATQLVDLETTGTTGNDSLFGGQLGGNLFDGKGGDDFEKGNGNGDTFVFNQGYGQLEIDETGDAAFAGYGTAPVNPINVLELGAGISASTLQVRATTDGKSLILTDGTVGDQITLDNILVPSQLQQSIELVQFADGSILTAQQLVEMALQQSATTGSDILAGSPLGGNYFDGEGGGDIEIGNGNGDTFVFNQGYGTLDIRETNSTNALIPQATVLQLGAGISAADIQVHATSDGSGLVITDGTAGDQITIEGMLQANSREGISEVQFSDGSVLNATQLINYETTGTSGNDILYGGADGGNVFDGDGGDDVEVGRGNGDTFVFDAGYGALGIDEQNIAPGYGAPNVLELGQGITAADLGVSATADGTGLVITDGIAGDQITIDGMLAQSGVVAGIDEVQFSDGSTLSVTQLVDLETTGTTGNDTLYGSAAGSNLFDGKGGDDLDIANGPNDTFVFDAGYGSLQIENAEGTGVLELGAGITEASITIHQSSDGKDLILTDGVSGDEITIGNMLAGQGIQEIDFSDGTVLTAQQLLVGATTGTTGNDTLYGSPDGSNLFDGKGGNDLEIGNGRSDTFVFNQGYGQLQIDENGATDSPDNVLLLGNGISLSDLNVKATADGTGLILTDGVSGDKITLQNMINPDSAGFAGVEAVQFSDGTTLSAQQLVDLETTGTSGNDVLYGSPNDPGELFDGKGGHDVAIGYGNGDTFVFNQGYGYFEVNATNYDASQGGALDQLSFGAGIDASDLTVRATIGGGGLEIFDGISGDEVVIDNALVAG